MTCEISFYQYDDLLVRSLAPIVIKSLEEKTKVLILCQDENQIREVDLTLWSYGRNKFIPHVKISDKGFDIQRQPVLITDNQENLNEAEYLIFLVAPKEEFIKQFKRAFYFYEACDGAFAKELSKSLSPKRSFKKEEGRWVTV